MSMGANELLAKSLKALNHMRRQAVSRSRSDGNSYDLAGHIHDYFVEQGVQPHSPGWEEKAVALDDGSAIALAPAAAEMRAAS
jgi:hypothetical protein